MEKKEKRNYGTRKISSQTLKKFIYLHKHLWHVAETAERARQQLRRLRQGFKNR